MKASIQELTYDVWYILDVINFLLVIGNQAELTLYLYECTFKAVQVAKQVSQKVRKHQCKRIIILFWSLWAYAVMVFTLVTCKHSYVLIGFLFLCFKTNSFPVPFCALSCHLAAEGAMRGKVLLSSCSPELDSSQSNSAFRNAEIKVDRCTWLHTCMSCNLKPDPTSKFP